MRRLTHFAKAREELENEVRTSSYSNIIPLISDGNVIPIISNSFYIRQIFAEESEVTDAIPETGQLDDENLTHDEAITREWATLIGYPMTENHVLARVAQYHLVEEEAKEGVTPNLARAKYINFMKDFLLQVF